MDASLMRDRQAFLKRALANPTVESKRTSEPTTDSQPKKKAKSSQNSSHHVMSYKTGATASQFKFGVLARIVRHMKTRHQDGEVHALTIDEILDETNQLNVGTRVKQWLISESLPNNPKIEESDGKYLFKPPLNVKDKKSLLKLLRQHDMKGLGGIMMDDVQESVPHYEKVMKHIDKEILKITRHTDKKQILFYHDRGLKFSVDKEFQQLWRNTSVDSLQDDNIEQYLKKQGIKSMQDHAKKHSIPIRKRTKPKKRLTKISDNEHLSDILKNYDV